MTLANRVIHYDWIEFGRDVDKARKWVVVERGIGWGVCLSFLILLVFFLSTFPFNFLNQTIKIAELDEQVRVTQQ